MFLIKAKVYLYEAFPKEWIGAKMFVVAKQISKERRFVPTVYTKNKQLENGRYITWSYTKYIRGTTFVLCVK